VRNIWSGDNNLLEEGWLALDLGFFMSTIAVLKSVFVDVVEC